MFKRGDPRPRGYSWRHMTLQHLMKIRTHVRMRCEDCGHDAVHSPAWMATMCGVPYGTTLYELAQRLVCRKCRSHKVGIESGD
jgi:hypothetical protein